MKPKVTNRPNRPLPGEVSYYLSGEPNFALHLYAHRMCVSEVTAEEAIRSYLTDLGFPELPPPTPRVS
jgi:hypothetical protein